MPTSLSATTIKEWFQYRCERKTRYGLMERKDRAAAAVLEDSRRQEWAELGVEFESLVVQRLAEVEHVLQPPGAQEHLGEVETIAFLMGRKPYVYAAQPALTAGTYVHKAMKLPEAVHIRRTFPDLIKRTTCPDGSIELTVIEIKATRAATAFHKTQVAFYARLLEGILADLGSAAKVSNSGEIWTVATGASAAEGQWRVEEFSLAPYRRLVDDFFARDLPRIIGRRVDKGVDETFFHLYFKCEQCDYLTHCRRSIETNDPAARDVSAVPGISHEGKRTLARQGLRTVGQLAATTADAIGGGASWSLQRRGEHLAARARAIVEGAPRRLIDIQTYLMPPRTDVGFYLVADHDPVEDSLVTLGYLYRNGTKSRATIRVIESSNDEQNALVEVLGALLSDMGAIDAHNAGTPDAPLRAHLFLYEPAEAKALQNALARHLNDSRLRGALLHAIRLFPPDEVVPEPEFRGVHHLPATAVRSVIEQLYALPVSVSYDLRQVSQALAEAGAVGVSYAPDAPFHRDFSSLLSMDVIRRLRQGRRRGRIAPADVEADVRARLETTATLVEWLWQENEAGPPFLRLVKQPFRFQATLNPLEAADLDLLQAYELLESRSQLLETMVRLAQPARVRQRSGACLAELHLLTHGQHERARYRLRFRVPPDSRDSDISPDDIALILTNGDPDILLNQQEWSAYEVTLERDKWDGDVVTAVLYARQAQAAPFQRLLRETPQDGWYIDRTYKDINGPRIHAFLDHLDD